MRATVMSAIWWLASLAGCYPALHGEVYEVDGQAEATKTIWVDSYGMTDPPPAVHWATGAELTCTCDDGTPGFPVAASLRDELFGGGECSGGETSPDGIAIAMGPSEPLADTSLAHEMYHWRQMLRGEDWHAHPADVFGNGGIVDQVNANVRVAESR